MGIVAGRDEQQDQRQLVAWKLRDELGNGLLGARSLRLRDGNPRRAAKPTVGLPHSVSLLEDRLVSCQVPVKCPKSMAFFILSQYGDQTRGARVPRINATFARGGGRIYRPLFILP